MYIFAFHQTKYKMQKRLLPKRFLEADIKKWQQAAKTENRNLTNWMETVLNNAIELLKLKQKK